MVSGDMTGAILAALARSRHIQFIGLPAISASGLPGSRLAAIRAGIIIIVLSGNARG